MLQLFIETPKGHKNQRLRWSNYKHHNTMKILIAVAPNSSIIFASKNCSGSISGKVLTNRLVIWIELIIIINSWHTKDLTLQMIVHLGVLN